MVQPRADGREAGRAVTLALADACVGPDEIDWVSAHASSTPIGDIAEARAISASLGSRAATVPVSATKALTGHPLGATGAIEAAMATLAVAEGWVPGTVNLEAPEPELGELLPNLLHEGTDGRFERVLSTSFGFGGLNAALVLGTPAA
jgi:3-oxoacyl-[acyl-carrier-protein] synthase II